MTALTIRTFDETLKRELKVRAARNNRSMEAEATAILERALTKPDVPKNIPQLVRARLAMHGLNGVDLVLDQREPMGEPPPIK